MASEIRVNKIINRSGLSTVTFSDTGAIVSGIVTANSFSGNVTGNVIGAVTVSGANLTSIPAGQLTGTVADARLTSVTASKLSGALPAISAANLTSIPAANITGTLPAISAANLTSIPAANLTGTLPAISGANLTGVGSLTLLSTTTISSEVSTITISNSFNAYDVYMIGIDRISCTVDTRDFHCYVRDGNNITGDYSVATYGSDGNSYTSYGSSDLRFQYNSIGNEVSGSWIQDDFYMRMFCAGFEANRTWRAWGQTCYGDGGNPGAAKGQGFTARCMRSAAINEIRFYWQSGNFRAGGHIKLYGVS